MGVNSIKIIGNTQDFDEQAYATYTVIFRTILDADTIADGDYIGTQIGLLGGLEIGSIWSSHYKLWDDSFTVLNEKYSGEITNHFPCSTR